jgi:hypothetical protein
MKQIDRLRIERCAYSPHRLGPAATAELLAQVASRIGGLPCIVCCLTECEQRHTNAVRRSSQGRASVKMEFAP